MSHGLRVVAVVLHCETVRIRLFPGPVKLPRLSGKVSATSFALLVLHHSRGKLRECSLPRVHIGLIFVILPLSDSSLTIFNPMRTQL